MFVKNLSRLSAWARLFLVNCLRSGLGLVSAPLKSNIKKAVLILIIFKISRRNKVHLLTHRPDGLIQSKKALVSKKEQLFDGTVRRCELNISACILHYYRSFSLSKMEKIQRHWECWQKWKENYVGIFQSSNYTTLQILIYTGLNKKYPKPFGP